MFRNPFRKDPDGLEDWLVSPRGKIQREKALPSEALARWRSHREGFDQTGLWPVIIPVEHVENLEQLFDEQAASVEDDIAMGVALKAADFFSSKLSERLEDEADDPEEDVEVRVDLDFDPSNLKVEEKPPIERQVAAVNDMLEHNGSQEGIWIALVPCREPWEVPAVLGYGSWNDCPASAEHVAVFREWHARHGAVPLVMGQDTVELFVRPIDDPVVAKRLAIEQFAYCSDIVDQGTESVEALASGLLGASVWFFWWD